MASITVENLDKRFGTLAVIEDLSLEVEDGEFLVLLGPSGCGKSTLLRMIAGLEAASAGAIAIGGRRVEDEPPGRRDVAFVFQSYALYPHLTVAENIAFPLVMKRFRPWMHLPLVGGLARRRIARAPDVAGTVADVARILGLEALMDRLPRTLSGGQRQRVALGRAMVRQPAVFLMDEPLSNLDAKLRTSMRAEIARLHARLGGTFVYVTHDQVEAMTMGTRIALMRGGTIQQIGTPRELFEDPANAFVARFVGSPPMNLLHGTVAAGGLALGAARHTAPAAARLPEGTAVVVGVRPGDLALHDAPGPDRIPGTVTLVEHLGTHSVVAVRLAGVALEHDGEHDPEAADDSVMATVDGYSALALGAPVHVALRRDDPPLFDPATGGRIRAAAPVPRRDVA